jgi:hypothetical protein
LTYTLVTLPVAPKLKSIVLAGDRLPLPETVDCTTPLVTATVRSRLVVADVAGPTRITAAITPPMASAPRMTLSGVRKRRDVRGIRVAACGVAVSRR